MREKSVIPPHIISKPYRYNKRDADGNHRNTKNEKCAEGGMQRNTDGEISTWMDYRNFDFAMPFPEEIILWILPLPLWVEGRAAFHRIPSRHPGLNSARQAGDIGKTGS